MTNIGLLGAVSVGKTTLLRLFVLYLNKGTIASIEGGVACKVEKTDFSGEAILDPDTGVKETKTIHPNRVVFTETSSGKAHTLFAPGGDRGRAVVRMGVITISRIAKEIIAIFACDRPLEEQFVFFSDVRFFPTDIYVCWNKVDLIKGDDKEAVLEEYKNEVVDFFAKRKITVRAFFRTCGEQLPGMESYNDNAAKMILDIALDRIKK